MGIEHYAFALFITGLICLIATLLKVLFADVKRQRKLLDEKETSLLQLYQSVEGIMEDFTDQVETATRELKEYEDRIAKRAITSSKHPEPSRHDPGAKPLRPFTVEQNRIRAASEVIERAERVIKGDTPMQSSKNDSRPVFQRFFDETINEVHANEVESSAKQSRNDSIVALAAEGKSFSHIAQELGITQNEVKFVVELNSRKL